MPIIGFFLVMRYQEMVDSKDWKTYTNTEYGYSLTYPATWSITYPITTGMVEFKGYGGRILLSMDDREQECPGASETIQVKIGNELLSTCHQYTLHREEEFWDQIKKVLVGGQTFNIWAEVYGPIEKNREVILKIFSSFKFTDQADGKNPKNMCEGEKGTWLNDYKECMGLNKQMCESIGGNFNACASACRHNPKAEMCIQMCVEVCEF